MSEWTPRRDGPWVALDVGLLRNRKLSDISTPAVLLYIACLMHCGDELTDGHVRAGALRWILGEARATRKHLHELERGGLLEPVDGGHTIPDYLEWNPSRAWWERKREHERERKAEYRRRQRAEHEPSRGASTSQVDPQARHEQAGTQTPKHAQPKPHEHKARGTLSRGDNPTDVPGGTPPTNENETRSTRSSSPKGTGSRENGQGLTAPSLLVESLRLELERLTGPDGVPV